MFFKPMCFLNHWFLTTLTCTGVVQVYTECWCTTLGPAKRFAGPMDQPNFHPVTEKVLPAEPIVMVLSHMPGKVAAREK